MRDGGVAGKSDEDEDACVAISGTGRISQQLNH